MITDVTLVPTLLLECRTCIAPSVKIEGPAPWACRYVLQMTPCGSLHACMHALSPPSTALCATQAPFISDIDKMDHEADYLHFKIKNVITRLTEGLQLWGGSKLPQSVAHALHRVCKRIRIFVQQYEECETRDYCFGSGWRNHKCCALIVDLSDDGGAECMHALDVALSRGYTWGDTIRWSQPMATLYSELMAMSWRLDSEKYAFIPPDDS